VPFVEQVDAETYAALMRVMFDDEELEDLFAAMDRDEVPS
jgi:hypothetical protein